MSICEQFRIPDFTIASSAVSQIIALMTSEHIVALYVIYGEISGSFHLFNYAFGNLFDVQNEHLVPSRSR